jgi:hypothetical protein
MAKTSCGSKRGDRARGCVGNLGSIEASFRKLGSQPLGEEVVPNLRGRSLLLREGIVCLRREPIKSIQGRGAGEGGLAASDDPSPQIEDRGSWRARGRRRRGWSAVDRVLVDVSKARPTATVRSSGVAGVKVEAGGREEVLADVRQGLQRRKKVASL